MAIAGEPVGLLGAITSLGGAALTEARTVLVSEQESEIARANASAVTAASVLQQQQTTMMVMVGGVLIGLYLLNR